MKSWRTLTPTKVCLIILLMAYIHGDIGSFYRASETWKIPAKFDENSICLLLISDPQILGYIAEGPRSLSPLLRWDSDRYLRKSFTTALSRIKPDVIVLLGDVFNEGFAATDQQFLDTKARFDWIFNTGYREIPMVVVVGDNDIGGEEFDFMRKDVVARFVKNFGPLNEVVNLKSFQLIKLNTASFVRNAYGDDEEKVLNDTAYFIESQLPSMMNSSAMKIVLAHAPLPNLPRELFKKVIISAEPKVAASGHIHKALQVNHRHQTPPIRFLEYVIPTCSYRMGTDVMGMGVLVVDSHGKVRLSILKLPERYYYLFMYSVICCVTVVVYLLSIKCIRRVVFTVLYKICYIVISKCHNRLLKVEETSWMSCLNVLLCFILLILCFCSLLILLHFSS